jgi:hypothetical protein
MHVFVFLLVVWFYDADIAPVIEVDQAQPTMQACQAVRAHAIAHWAGKAAVREVEARCADFVRGNTA